MRLEVFIIILGMGLATYATRFGSLALLSRIGVPAWFDRWLEHVPTGILTALIVPTLFIQQGKIDISLNNHYLLAGIIAALVAYRSRNTLLTLVIGMAAILLLRTVIG